MVVRSLVSRRREPAKPFGVRLAAAASALGRDRARVRSWRIWSITTLSHRCFRIPVRNLDPPFAGTAPRGVPVEDQAVAGRRPNTAWTRRHSAIAWTVSKTRPWASW